jgi:hypothetical protein
MSIASENRLRLEVAKAIQRTFSLAGLTQKESAALLCLDQGQVSRWTSGVERPHFDAIFVVEVLRRPMLVALAEMIGEGVQIETVVRILGSLSHDR